jgi:mono/diheme cytochrome c family protein
VRPALLVLATSLLACRTEQTLVTPDPHLERMLKQEKVLPYENDPILPRGMAMQSPPEGTLPTDSLLDGPLVLAGAANGRWAARIPVRVDRPLLDEGRRRFDTHCATCHGELGDGTSAVAERMALRRPKSLVDAGARDFPAGRIFQAIREGYGLMPPYRVQLGVKESWGVVAYVRALQRARGVRVADLPPDVRARLEEEAR